MLVVGQKLAFRSILETPFMKPILKKYCYHDVTEFRVCFSHSATGYIIQPATRNLRLCPPPVNSLYHN